MKNSHPPIVSADLFDHVQRELEHRKGLCCVASAGCFAGRVVCGDCGGLYGAKVWHSNAKYRRTVWRCNNKYEKDGKKRCTPHFYEDQMKAMFVQVMNERFTRKDEIGAAYKETIDDLTSNRQLETEQKRLQTEIDIVLDMMRRMVLDNARVAQNQSEYGNVMARSLSAMTAYRPSLTRLTVRSWSATRNAPSLSKPSR
ncbi:MAG: zinc ribbon domain-containing protein [Eubacteriales bacterium]|nr:zinc ribbon domain-containing protein [Eubacteriales bacterium]